MRKLITSYLFPAAVILAAALIAAAVSAPFKRCVENAETKALDPESLKAALGKGMLFGVLGGYRSLVADFVWIKSYVDWENKDIPACMASMELAAAIDPYMELYWTQGAAIIAYDFPYWQLRTLPKNLQSAGALERLKLRNAEIALDFLDRGLKIFPKSEALLLKKGQIAISSGKFAIARACFADLTSLPNPSVYSRRIYAALLERDADTELALKVLENTIADVDKDTPVYKIISEQIEQAKAKLRKEKAD